jgi:hypothetical protein
MCLKILRDKFRREAKACRMTQPGPRFIPNVTGRLRIGLRCGGHRLQL